MFVIVFEGLSYFKPKFLVEFDGRVVVFLNVKVELMNGNL